MNSVTAKPERWLIERLCAALPLSVTPDQLTLVGLFGALFVFTGYVLSNLSAWFLAISVFGYLLHWFGDSLDGSLARHRSIERPRYGYFVDHAADALSNTIIAIGLGLSFAVRMDVALFSIVGYLLLSIFVFLKRQVLDEFQLAFAALGPTEVRIALIALTLFMPLMATHRWNIVGEEFSVCDVFIALAGAAFILIFVLSVFQTIRRLNLLT